MNIDDLIKIANFNNKKENTMNIDDLIKIASLLKSDENTMNIDDLIKIASLLKSDDNSVKVGEHPYKIGEAYLIRTVTMIDMGRLEKVGDKELVLTSASWIADTSRFSDCLLTGQLGEVEPFPEGEVIVGRGAIVDAVIWTHALPREKK